MFSTALILSSIGFAQAAKDSCQDVLHLEHPNALTIHQGLRPSARRKRFNRGMSQTRFYLYREWVEPMSHSAIFEKDEIGIHFISDKTGHRSFPMKNELIPQDLQYEAVRDTCIQYQVVENGESVLIEDLTEDYKKGDKITHEKFYILEDLRNKTGMIYYSKKTRDEPDDNFKVYSRTPRHHWKYVGPDADAYYRLETDREVFPIKKEYKWGVYRVLQDVTSKNRYTGAPSKKYREGDYVVAKLQTSPTDSNLQVQTERYFEIGPQSRRRIPLLQDDGTPFLRESRQKYTVNNPSLAQYIGRFDENMPDDSPDSDETGPAWQVYKLLRKVKPVNPQTGERHATVPANTYIIARYMGKAEQHPVLRYLETKSDNWRIPIIWKDQPVVKCLKIAPEEVYYSWPEDGSYWLNPSDV